MDVSCEDSVDFHDGICTLSPLRAALTMQFAENTHHDMSKELRLPQNTFSIRGSICEAMAKSTWSDEDEKALLFLLQKKWNASSSGYTTGSSIPPPLESQGSMTDGSKRLRDAMADDGFDLVSVTSESAGVQLPVLPTPLFPGIAGKDLDQIVFEHLPEGMSLRDGSRTKFVSGKLANSGKTYREVYTDEEMVGYCNWCMNHLGGKTSGAVAKDMGTRSYVLAKQWRFLDWSESSKECFAGTSIPRQLGD